MTPLDQDAFKIFEHLPTLSLASLLRPDQTSLREARRAIKLGEEMTLRYPRVERVPLAALKAEVREVQKKIDALKSDEVIKEIYREKIEEYTNKLALIEMIQAQNNVGAEKVLRDLFQSDASHILKKCDEIFAEHLRARATSPKHRHAKKMTSEEFADAARQTLDAYGLHDWRIALSTRKKIRLSHGARNKTPLLRIPKSLQISRQRAKRLLAHEIEVHALRLKNSESLPLLLARRGLASYQVTEEGLAIVHQENVVQKTSLPPGFWEAWSAALIKKHGPHEAFKKIRDALDALETEPTKKTDKKALRLTLSALHGATHITHDTHFWNARSARYIAGAEMVRALSKEDQRLLWHGKIHIDHLPFLRSLGITGDPHTLPQSDIIKEIMQKKIRTD